MLRKKKNHTKHIESKEGQRNFLCSNKGDGRCPSLGFNSNDLSEDMALDIYARLLIRAALNEIRDERKRKQ